MGIIVKSPDEIATMRKAGRVVSRVLKRLAGEIRPGMRTEELELISLEELALHGARSSFKGYRGFPASVCHAPVEPRQAQFRSDFARGRSVLRPSNLWRENHLEDGWGLDQLDPPDWISQLFCVSRAPTRVVGALCILIDKIGLLVLGIGY